MSDQTEIPLNLVIPGQKQYKISDNIKALPRISADWASVSALGDQYIVTFGLRHDTMGIDSENLVEPQVCLSLSPSMMESFITTAQLTVKQAKEAQERMKPNE